MRIPPQNFLVPGRGAAMKGVGVWYWRDGILVFAKWPRAQPRARTAAEQFNRDAFQVSTQIVKIMDSYQIDFARSLSQATQLAAQDFLYIALFGRIGHMVRRDGRIIFSMAAMQDVSRTLDAIYQLQGGILVRGPTFWAGLEPGDIGQFLGIGLDGLPAYLTPDAQIGAPWYMQPPPMVPDLASNIFGGNGFAGMPFYAEISTVIQGLRLWCVTPGSGHTTYAGLYTANPTTQSLQGATLAGQGAAAPLVAGLNELPLASPVTLVAGKWYWAGPVILGAGNVNFAAGMSSRNNRFFTQTTGTLPTNPGVNTASAGNNVSWWLY